MGGGLVLRDIHQPPAPGWWPPAPGWWLLAALLLAAILALAWWRMRVRRRRQRLQALFDATVDAAGNPPAAVAAVSEPLRRSLRDVDPAATTLAGRDWTAYLRTAPGGQALGEGSLALLEDGGYRRDVDAAAVARLRDEARALFLAWNTRR